MADLDEVLNTTRDWARGELEDAKLRMADLRRFIRAVDAYFASQQLAEQGREQARARAAGVGSPSGEGPKKAQEPGSGAPNNPTLTTPDSAKHQVTEGLLGLDQPSGPRKYVQLSVGDLGTGASGKYGTVPRIHQVKQVKPWGQGERWATKWLCNNTSMGAQAAPDGAELSCPRCIKMRDNPPKPRPPPKPKKAPVPVVPAGELADRLRERAARSREAKRAQKAEKIKVQWPEDPPKPPQKPAVYLDCPCGCGREGYLSRRTGHTRNCWCTPCGLYREELVRTADQRRQNQANSMPY
jgi:hypothetical protein